MQRLATHIRRAIWRSVSNDVFTLAKAGAYSAILCVFPAILVVATVVAMAPGAEDIRDAILTLLSRLLPDDALPIVLSYFQAGTRHTLQVVISASFISVLAASDVMVTLMECSRRAYGLAHTWGFWRTRWVALILVPLSLVPMTFASLLIVFGHTIEHWMIANADHDLRISVLFLWRMIRWAIALSTSVAVIAVIYHMGTPRTQSWRCVLPGAAVATVLWFSSTLGFGLYVTRYANYSQVYGSLGAGIALLIWLYIIMISIMVGAEFNAQVFPKSALSGSPESEQGGLNSPVMTGIGTL